MELAKRSNKSEVTCKIVHVNVVEGHVNYRVGEWYVHTEKEGQRKRDPRYGIRHQRTAAVTGTSGSTLYIELIPVSSTSLPLRCRMYEKEKVSVNGSAGAEVLP
jgi:hypothetical protein